MNDEELTKLESSLEAMERDAARYRWLTSGIVERQLSKLPDIGGRSILRNEQRSLMEFRYWCTPDELDAAIDAQINPVA